jgi:hypothetical protein
MNTVDLATLGGTLFMLVVLHLVGDWVLQTHDIAMRKVKEPLVRALHVNIYTMVFALVLFPLNKQDLSLCIVWIWVTHFIIDSYKPLYWFRHWLGDPDAETWDKFKEAFTTTRGFVVYVALDQIFHLLTLIPVAYYIAIT